MPFFRYILQLARMWYCNNNFRRPTARPTNRHWVTAPTSRGISYENDIKQINRGYTPCGWIRSWLLFWRSDSNPRTTCDKEYTDRRVNNKPLWNASGSWSITRWPVDMLKFLGKTAAPPFTGSLLHSHINQKGTFLQYYQFPIIFGFRKNLHPWDFAPRCLMWLQI